MKLSNDDGDGIKNVTIEIGISLCFSKLSGCDLNVKYR